MMEEKILIFDASSIITLALNNLLYLLRGLKTEFNVRFIMSEEVRREVIDQPLQIKRYELEALMIRQLVKDNVLQFPESIGIESKKVTEETNQVMRTANKMFRAGSRFIRIISAGESSCFALSRILKTKDIDSVLAVDERTARMLSENAENLRRLMEKKLHTKINVQKNSLAYFSGFKVIRSAELCWVAYKKGLVGIADGVQLLDGLLYATKYKGCAISNQEIEEIKRLI